MDPDCVRAKHPSGQLSFGFQQAVACLSRFCWYTKALVYSLPFPSPVSLNIAVRERMGEEWFYLFCIKQSVVCLNMDVAEIREEVLNVLIETLN